MIYDLVCTLSFVALLSLLALPLGRYIAWTLAEVNSEKHDLRVYLDKFAGWLVGPGLIRTMSWRVYASALLITNLLGILLVYLLQRCQAYLPFNSFNLPSVAPDLAFNTAVSFASNTNWQAYSGESTLSVLTQMLGLCSQNFLSAATGIAVLAALIRGFKLKEATGIGNYFQDMLRCTALILLPLAVIVATLLVSQGVVQTLDGKLSIKLFETQVLTSGEQITHVDIPLGPVASQVAIKQLGTNGGGFYGVNSAHPLENSTAWANLIELFSILLIPAALCFSFGHMIQDKRQGLALYCVMLAIFVPAVLITSISELRVSSNVPDQVKLNDSRGIPYGNLEGKELRFGRYMSALWAVSTTAASNGSVNSMHDSYTPMGGLPPLLMMQLGEVIFGGVGSGLYGLLAFVLVTVFVAGLMVGRTPEYLGKKIEVFEMKMVALIILIPPLVSLIGTAIAVSYAAETPSFTNPGPHAFSQALYAYSSMGNNNGSAFAGFLANFPLHNLLGASVMFISRYWLIFPVLALAESLAGKKLVPVSTGTLPTHTPIFIFLLVAVILIVGALTYFPALALGPIAEELLF